jgi:hypothetical protein
MKYSKPGKIFLKWFLLICILLLLVVVIYYKYNNYTKEFLRICDENEFHSKITYSRFEDLSSTRKKEYGDVFKALKKYIKTNKINIERSGDRFRVYKNKKGLKWTIKSGQIKMFDIKNGTLVPSIICKSTDSFTTLVEGFFGSDSGDKITITSQDIALFIENNLFNLNIDNDDYDLIANPDNCFSCYSFIYGSSINNCSQPNRIKYLYELINKNKLKIQICTAEDDPLEFKTAIIADPQSGISFSSGELKPDLRIDIVKAIKHVFNNRLNTSDTESPYYSFEIIHDNLILLSKNIIDALEGKSKNKLYCWLVKET